MSKFAAGGAVMLEACEHYQKQSFRNRCCISAANGLQNLVIPVTGGSEGRPVTAVEIDYSMPWQKNHLRSIESAYNTSAFYEFYADDFQAFFQKKTKLLFAWNMDLLKWVLEALRLPVTFSLTEVYEKKPSLYTDFRQGIHPKVRYDLPDPTFTPLPYQQVFIERSGFLANLSVIDLIFNEGPRAEAVLREMCL
jgi:hypothetical protein